MKKTSLVCAALFAATAPVSAADVGSPYGPAPYFSPGPIGGGYFWTGGYVGANFGYQWGRFTGSSLDPDGVNGGLQAGFNWQTGQFVFGGEIDAQLSSAEDTFGAYKFSNPWFGTARGRFGYAMNNILLFATAGLALGGGEVDLAGAIESQTHFGWTAGGGIEVGFTPRWSAKAEYLYVGLSDQGYVLTGVNNGITANILRFGVNYRF